MICKICKIEKGEKEFHRNQRRCIECCRTIQNKRTANEREMLEKAKAEGRGTMEWCRRWNARHPIIRTPLFADVIAEELRIAKVEFGI